MEEHKQQWRWRERTPTACNIAIDSQLAVSVLRAEHLLQSHRARVAPSDVHIQYQSPSFTVPVCCNQMETGQLHISVWYVLGQPCLNETQALPVRDVMKSIISYQGGSSLVLFDMEFTFSIITEGTAGLNLYHPIHRLANSLAPARQPRYF